MDAFLQRPIARTPVFVALRHCAFARLTHHSSEVLVEERRHPLRLAGRGLHLQPDRQIVGIEGIALPARQVKRKFEPLAESNRLGERPRPGQRQPIFGVQVRQAICQMQVGPTGLLAEDFDFQQTQAGHVPCAPDPIVSHRRPIASGTPERHEERETLFVAGDGQVVVGEAVAVVAFGNDLNGQLPCAGGRTETESNAGNIVQVAYPHRDLEGQQPAVLALLWLSQFTVERDVCQLHPAGRDAHGHRSRISAPEQQERNDRVGHCDEQPETLSPMNRHSQSLPARFLSYRRASVGRLRISLQAQLAFVCLDYSSLVSICLMASAAAWRTSSRGSSRAVFRAGSAAGSPMRPNALAAADRIRQ